MVCEILFEKVYEESPETTATKFVLYLDYLLSIALPILGLPLINASCSWLLALIGLLHKFGDQLQKECFWSRWQCSRTDWVELDDPGHIIIDLRVGSIRLHFLRILLHKIALSLVRQLNCRHYLFQFTAQSFVVTLVSFLLLLEYASE